MANTRGRNPQDRKVFSLSKEVIAQFENPGRILTSTNTKESTDIPANLMQLLKRKATAQNRNFQLMQLRGLDHCRIKM